MKGRQNLADAIETGDCLRVGWKDLHVAHCPLHAAAPELLAAAEYVADMLAQTLPDGETMADRIGLAGGNRAAELCRIALAKVKGS